MSRRNRSSSILWQLAGRTDFDPRRGEFDGQRNAVQPPADLGDRRSSGRIEREVRLHEPRAVDEQLHGLERFEPVGLISGRTRKRADPHCLFARHARGLTTGRQHFEPLGATEQSHDQRCARTHDMLAIVEHEQHLLFCDVLVQRLDDRTAALLGQPQRPRNGRWQTLGVCHRREVDEPGAIGERRQKARREFNRSARLPAAACSGQRHQPVGSNDLFVFIEIGFTTDEAGQRAGQIVAVDISRHLGRRRHLCREAVPPPRHRLDDPVAENPAERGNLNLEIVLLDDQSGPREVEQLVLAHQPLAPFDQRNEHIERPAAQCGRPPLDQQFPDGRPQFESAKAIVSGHWRWCVAAIRAGPAFQNVYGTLKDRGDCAAESTPVARADFPPTSSGMKGSRQVRSSVPSMQRRAHESGSSYVQEIRRPLGTQRRSRNRFDE